MLLGLVAPLAACAVGPNFHAPAVPTVATYTPHQDGPGGPRLISGEKVDAQWWHVFGSADLNALVDTALQHNPSLTAAQETLRAAHETMLAQRAQFFPSVSASISPTGQRTAGVLASGVSSGASIYTLTTSQLAVSYTPDIFGANRRAVEALVAQEQAQRFEYEAARLTIISNVISAAITDASLRAQIADTQTAVTDADAILDSLRKQLGLGQAAEADVAAQETLVAQLKATLPALEKQRELNQDLLAALTGRTPAELDETHFDFASMSLPDDVPLSLPSTLVTQRPDVRIAEAQLHAACAQVGVAEAALWPNFNITAAAGAANLGYGLALNGNTSFWSWTATLTQPIFDGGMLIHQKRAAMDQYRASAAQYQSTVLSAFQNMADVLNALRADGLAYTAAVDAEQASGKSLKIAKRQLDLGDVSQVVVLNAEQGYVQAHMAEIQAKANRYADVAALFQALGGGWQS